TPGRTSAGNPAMASARAAVPRTRPTRIRSLYASVQRRLPTPAPARFTTASHPASPLASTTPRSGSQDTSSGPWAARRTSRTTVCPSAVRDRARAPPMSPDAPATAMRARSMASILPRRPYSAHMPHIRVARPTDEGDLARLDRETWSPAHAVTPQPRPHDTFFTESAGPGAHHVAEHNGRLVGYVRLGHPTELASNAHV